MAQNRFDPFEPPVEVTPDEWEVLDLLRQGLTRQVIADRLEVSEAIVRARINNVAAKLRLLAQM